MTSKWTVLTSRFRCINPSMSSDAYIYIYIYMCVCGCVCVCVCVCLWKSKQVWNWFTQWLVDFSVTSHCVNQYWLILTWAIGNKFQWNFNQNTTVFLEENWFENVVCEMAFKSSRLKSIIILIPKRCWNVRRDHFCMRPYNARRRYVSDWLGAYTKWSLRTWCMCQMACLIKC